MNGNGSTGGVWGTVLADFAAELTSAAYGIALRHGTRGSWVDLELALWRVLDETVRKWGRELTRAGRPGAFAVWREEFLAELTAAACRTTLRYGVQGSFREVERGLYRAFRSLIGEIGREPLPDGTSLRPMRVASPGQRGAQAARLDSEIRNVNQGRDVQVGPTGAPELTR